MLCHTLALILLAQVTHPTRTAYVTSSPLLATIDRILGKLENLTVAPKTSTPPGLSDDEEEMLSAIQTWGRLTPDQLDGVAKDLQRMKADADDDRTQRLTELYYAEMDDNDEEYADIEYHNDGEDDEDIDTRFTIQKSFARSPNDNTSFDDDEMITRPGVTPSAFTRNGPFHVISAVDPIAATNERPRIMDDSELTALERKGLRDAVLQSIKRVVRESKCLVPQPRWLSVRQLAPASDTLFMPPCVELHRCAPDSGCCDSEAEVCAPIDGRYVMLPFYLHKADGNMSVARMVFFNHTRCACVSRDTLQRTVPITHPERAPPRSEERQNDWRPPLVQATVEPRSEEDVTAPPQMRRCTCPTPFLASTSENGPCVCGCKWRDLDYRRDCLYLSRGKEHLGLRDRVCIEDGDCDPPACEYGPYDRRKGKCPKSSRKRFHEKRHHQERNVV